MLFFFCFSPLIVILISPYRLVLFSLSFLWTCMVWNKIFLKRLNWDVYNSDGGPSQLPLTKRASHNICLMYGGDIKHMVLKRAGPSSLCYSDILFICFIAAGWWDHQSLTHVFWRRRVIALAWHHLWLGFQTESVELCGNGREGLTNNIRGSAFSLSSPLQEIIFFFDLSDRPGFHRLSICFWWLYVHVRIGFLYLIAGQLAIFGFQHRWQIRIPEPMWKM